MRRRGVPFALVLAVAPVLPVVSASACGGAVDSGLLTGPATEAGTSQQGGDAGGGGQDTGLPPFDASTGVDTGASVDSGTTTVDVFTLPESGPSGPSVLCPNMGNPQTCNPGQICCITGSAMQGNQVDTCQPSGQGCSGGTAVRCGSGADCTGGKICCGTQQLVNGMYEYTEVTCAATCAGTTQRIFCDPQNNTCPAATPTCGQSQLLPGYSVCQ